MQLVSSVQGSFRGETVNSSNRTRIEAMEMNHEKLALPRENNEQTPTAQVGMLSTYPQDMDLDSHPGQPEPIGQGSLRKRATKIHES